MKKLLLAAAVMTGATAVQAEGIPVEPGKWEMTSTMQMPMLPEPRVTTVTECMEKSEITMDDMGADEMDPNCSFDMKQLDGDTMSWSVDCPVEGGTSHGEWTATSAGDSVTGDGKIVVSFQGQSMEMTMSWTGQRIGPCD